MQPIQNAAQERFDSTFISSSEICKELNVSRATILQARRRGLLPHPIVVNDSQIYLWERVTVRPYIDAWKLILTVRRGNNV